VKKILELPNSKNQTMISFDVDNLYTDVPVNEAIKITLDNLFKGKNQPSIPFDRTQLKELLELAVCYIPLRFLDNT
jgi:5-methylcytosine-specific restriction endonuclease McrBC regulatory subunit McrC